MNSRNDSDQSNPWFSKNNQSSRSNGSSNSNVNSSSSNQYFNSSMNGDYLASEDMLDIYDYTWQAVANVDKKAHFEMRKNERTQFEEENAYAELAEFIEMLNYQQGNVCPQTSPVKSKPQSVRVKKDHGVAIEKHLSSKQMTQANVLTFFANKNLATMNDAHGRNYGRLANAVSEFNIRLAGYDKEKFFQFLKRNNINLSSMVKEDLEELIKNFKPMQLVVFLKLAKEYPLADRGYMYSYIMSDSSDVYSVYLSLKDLLYKSTLTEKAYEPYRFEAEMMELENNNDVHFFKDLEDEKGSSVTVYRR